MKLLYFPPAAPSPLDRLDYDALSGTVTYRSDKASGRTAGVHDFQPVDFIARLVLHIPDKGQVMQRYYRYYSNRGRGGRRTAATAGAADTEAPGVTAAEPLIVTPENFSRGDAHWRWAELLRRIYEVDPWSCPMRWGDAHRRLHPVPDSHRPGHGPPA